MPGRSLIFLSALARHVQQWCLAGLWLMAPCTGGRLDTIGHCTSCGAMCESWLDSGIAVAAIIELPVPRASGGAPAAHSLATLSAGTAGGAPDKECSSFRGRPYSHTHMQQQSSALSWLGPAVKWISEWPAMCTDYLVALPRSEPTYPLSAAAWLTRLRSTLTTLPAASVREVHGQLSLALADDALRYTRHRRTIAESVGRSASRTEAGAGFRLQPGLGVAHGLRTAANYSPVAFGPRMRVGEQRSHVLCAMTFAETGGPI
jgi:hypothetical protein